MMAYAFLTWVLLLMLLRAIAYETVQDAGKSVCTLILSVSDLSYYSAAFIATISRHMVEHSANSIGTMATVYPTDHPTMAGT